MEFKDLKDLWPALVAFGGLLGYVASLSGAFKGLKINTDQNTEAIAELRKTTVTKSEIADKLAIIDTKLSAASELWTIQVKNQKESLEKLTILVDNLSDKGKICTCHDSNTSKKTARPG